MKNTKFTMYFKFLILLMILSLIGNACTSGKAVTLANGSSDTPLAEAEVVFQAKLPSAFSNDESLALEVLDEVTGLALNPTRYSMSMIDGFSYFVRLNLPIGAVIKYRYVRVKDVPTPEYSTKNEPIRYRLYLVYGPAVQQDLIAGWMDQAYSGNLGRLQGQVISTDNSPAAGLLISICGLSTITSSDGTFMLDKIPEGSMNLVAYSIDGSYHTFQQGAVIAANAVTPAVFQVAPATFVSVTFMSTPPLGDYTKIPIRIVGNLYQLGNTFADLNGGFSVIAARSPQLDSMSGGKFTTTMQLPVGAYVEYKYSLGDGFWNAEHDSGGAFRVRKILVPDKDTVYDDVIDNWGIGKNAPIAFNVTVPATTPGSDIVSIQFNPYTWTNPIPIWKTGENQWSYTLISPLDILGEISYRYCRNDQCNINNNQPSLISYGTGPVFSPLPNSQTFIDTIQEWPNLESFILPVIADSVLARGNAFETGIEFTPLYSPTWLPYMINTMRELQSDSASLVTLSPSWTASDPFYAIIEPIFGLDPLIKDVESMAAMAHTYNMNVALYPRIQFSRGNQNYWQSAPRDSGWWQQWFGQYQHFLVNFADLATRINAKAIIIGGVDILPALPGGKLPDGQTSGVPVELANIWKPIIQDVRNHFTGQIIWDVPFPAGYETIPGWLTDVDAIQITWSAPLSQSNAASIEDLTTSWYQLLQNYAYPISQTYNKSIILGLKYGATDGAANGCAIAQDQGCVPFDVLNQPTADNPSIIVDLQEQADIYQAALRAVDQLPWITGFTTIGYYPPMTLTDKSISIHGKPAEKIIQYWYAYMRQ